MAIDQAPTPTDRPGVPQETTQKLGHFGRDVREELRRDLKAPTTAAAIAGATLAGIAMLIGAPETILGAAAGLIVYRILKSRQSSAQEPVNAR